ncbi:MAG: hypothetical protein AB7S38_36535 [Vulcanimicrobiota bacterium]
MNKSTLNLWPFGLIACLALGFLDRAGALNLTEAQTCLTIGLIAVLPLCGDFFLGERGQSAGRAITLVMAAALLDVLTGWRWPLWLLMAALLMTAWLVASPQQTELSNRLAGLHLAVVATMLPLREDPVWLSQSLLHLLFGVGLMSTVGYWRQSVVSTRLRDWTLSGMAVLSLGLWLTTAGELARQPQLSVLGSYVVGIYLICSPVVGWAISRQSSGVLALPLLAAATLSSAFFGVLIVLALMHHDAPVLQCLEAWLPFFVPGLLAGLSSEFERNPLVFDDDFGGSGVSFQEGLHPVGQ